jgi:ubiquinone biosynthesis protein UbiJ
MTGPASAIGEKLANRVLRDEAWAREKLAPHAGRSFTMACGPVTTGYSVRDDGTLGARAAGGGPADAELYLSPLDLPAFLADPSRWSALVTANGDPALIGTLKELAGTLPWFVERAFAKAFGPVVGQRMADAGRHVLAFPEYAGARLTENVASYLRDEAGALARGDEARRFAADSAELATRAEELEARIARLESAWTAAAK